MGPEFFERTVTGDSYLNKLKTVIVLALKQRPDFNNLNFQQDGAPPHFATAVRNFLDETFPDKWIGRRGPIEFSPRYPDITPMDFCVCGSHQRLCIRGSQEVLKIFDYLLTLIVTCAPKFVTVWYHVAENALKLKASNLNIYHSCSK